MAQAEKAGDETAKGGETGGERGEGKWLAPYWSFRPTDVSLAAPSRLVGRGGSTGTAQVHCDPAGSPDDGRNLGYCEVIYPSLTTDACSRSKYFRGRRLHGDWDIRVEQAEFRELSLTSNVETGCHVSMAVYRNGTKVMRSFRPDFLLIRQNLRDAGESFVNVLLGLKFGGIPSVNSLTAVYNFQDKPWVFGHLLQLQRRLGKENFPLIEQTFYPNYRE
ncbi:hypothetical protein FOCC_FOCC013001, partial [Frankliniella occidentalis]